MVSSHVTGCTGHKKNHFLFPIPIQIHYSKIKNLHQGVSDSKQMESEGSSYGQTEPESGDSGQTANVLLSVLQPYTSLSA